MSTNSISRVLSVLMLLSAITVLNAQTNTITGQVVDNGTSAGIANAKVKLLEFPSCTTRTNADGDFTISINSTRLSPRALPRTASQITCNLLGNNLSIRGGSVDNSATIVVDVFSVNGKRIFHEERVVAGMTEFPALWKAAGMYYVKVTAGHEIRVLSSAGLHRSVAFSSSAKPAAKGVAKTAAETYTIEAQKVGYDPKQVAVASLSGSAGVIRLSTYAQQPGTWMETTTDDTMKNGGYGVWGTVVDPVRKSDIYLAGDVRGIWKSTDYGLSWAKASTGINGDKLESGAPWYLAIDQNPNRDPATAPTLYCSQGYGWNGIWKSTNGGVDWHNTWNNFNDYDDKGEDNVYDSDGVTLISSDVGRDLTGAMMAGKNGPDHLVAFLHSYSGTGDNNGIFVTTDGGVKWIVKKSQTFSFQVHSDRLFVIDDSTWCVVHNTPRPEAEVYRTTNSGGSWTLSNGYMTSSAGKDPLILGQTIYSAGAAYLGFFKSTDKGASWTQPITEWTGWVEASATKLYRCSGDRWGTPTTYWAPLNDDTHWTAIPGPFAHGESEDAQVTFDGTHYIILASHKNAGIWRYVEP